eukprot:TRINITY_DN29880_c0_g2_i1.p1 TRINITY_DN29880_c0_g2~~TRINITY_DN29880_c0_g2_i1.p1  ORF type:complete len:637 (+),score=203.76 TRINITY_DN29880_c0_g2_i1:94-1911(+)
MADAKDIAVTMKRLDSEDKETFKMYVSQESDVKEIKERVDMEWGIIPKEQILIFRGKKLFEDFYQPFNTPDLQDVIAESGEDGLQMLVMFWPERLPPFMKKEGMEEVNEKRKSGGTALHRAVRQCRLYVVEELLKSKEFTLIDQRDKSGQTVLHAAVTCRFREAADIILKCPRFTMVGSKDATGQTALHIAAHTGDHVIIQWILKHPLFKPKQARTKDKNGFTAFQYADACCHEDCVDILERYLENTENAEGVGEAEGEEIKKWPLDGVFYNHDDFWVKYLESKEKRKFTDGEFYTNAMFKKRFIEETGQAKWNGEYCFKAEWREKWVESKGDGALIEEEEFEKAWEEAAGEEGYKFNEEELQVLWDEAAVAEAPCTTTTANARTGSTKLELAKYDGFKPGYKIQIEDMIIEVKSIESHMELVSKLAHQAKENALVKCVQEDWERQYLGIDEADCEAMWLVAEMPTQKDKEAAASQAAGVQPAEAEGGPPPGGEAAAAGEDVKEAAPANASSVEAAVAAGEDGKEAAAADGSSAEARAEETQLPPAADGNMSAATAAAGEATATVDTGAEDTDPLPPEAATMQSTESAADNTDNTEKPAGEASSS